MCDLETSRMGASYIYDISRLRVKIIRYYCQEKNNKKTTIKTLKSTEFFQKSGTKIQTVVNEFRGVSV